jgi:hypothetical protein
VPLLDGETFLAEQRGDPHDSIAEGLRGAGPDPAVLFD